MKKLFTFLTLVLFSIVVNAQETTKLIDYPTTKDGITLVSLKPATEGEGTTETTDVSYSTVKVKNVSTDCIKFGKSIKMDDNEKYYAELSVEGGFKSGDVISITGCYNNASEKNAAIAFYDQNKTNLWTTNNFLNTNDTSVEPTAQTFTLTADAEKLFIGRSGNTGTCILELTITRAETPEPQPVEEVILYTLDGSITSGGNSNYAQDGGGLTQNGMEWSVTGNTTINPWRIGGKTLSEVDREIYSKTAMASAITKAELGIGSINIESVNSIKLIVASDEAFANVIETIIIPSTDISASTTITFAPTSGDEWAAGAYYKFVFNLTESSNSNKYVQVPFINFYGFGTPVPEQPKLYVIGDGTTTPWDRTAMDEMAYNADTQTYTYQYVATSPLSYFAIADYQQTADEAAADPEWTDFNTNHRYYIANIDGAPTLDTEFDLTKGDGTIILGAGVYTISVKDMKVTISGEPAPEGTIFYAPMANGLDGFTTEAPNVWSYSSQYSCAYGTAYNKEVVGSFDLVSPVIDLTNKQNVVLTFSHAGKFFTNVAEEAQLLVKLEEDGAQWTPVAIPNHVTNENFNWVESGDIDLSAYNNAKIRIAFHYSNTEANNGGTWEIKNVVVTAKAATPTVEHLYLLGGNADWNFKDNVELPFDEEAQAFKYEIETENDHFFGFADKNDCASWDELNGDHRWAYVPRSSGDFAPELDVEYALTKVEGTFMLHAGKYTVTVTKDMKMTVTGEVTPILPAYIDYPTTAAGITIGGTTEMDAVVKIHNNTDEVKGIKFANGYTTEGALNGNYATIEIDGGFKAGDVISIAGAFNNSDETKQAAVDIFTLDETSNPVVLFTTQQFVNGRVSADDPVVEKFTLEADYDKLYLGRKGNTATFVTLLKTERSVAPTVEHLYLLGGNQDWTYANNAELPFDETTQAWTYEVNSPESEHYFAFADKNDCASWDELNGSHRWALEAGDIVPEINAEYALTKANGTVKLPAGQYTVTVTKDMMMTVKAVTDGIKSVQGSGFTVNGEAYNLAGQRVGKDYKGIVIVNGKKVLVK